MICPVCKASPEWLERSHDRMLCTNCGYLPKREKLEEAQAELEKEKEK